MSVTNLIKKDFRFIKLYFLQNYHKNANNFSHFKARSFSNVTVLYGSTLTVVNWSLVNRNCLLVSKNLKNLAIWPATLYQI